MMKFALGLTIIMLVLVAAMGAFAASGKAYMQTDTKVIFEFQSGNIITADNKSEFIEVTTRNNTFRIYPCGELRKLTWDKLNPNEDPAQTGVFSNYTSGPTYPTYRYSGGYVSY